MDCKLQVSLGNLVRSYLIIKFKEENGLGCSSWVKCHWVQSLILNNNNDNNKNDGDGDDDDDDIAKNFQIQYLFTYLFV